MNEPKHGMSCALGCWALAAGAGLLTFVLLLAIGGYKIFAALFLGAVLFVLLGLLLNWLFCAPLPKLGETSNPNVAGTAGQSSDAVKAAKIVTGASSPASAGSASVAQATSGSGSSAAATATAKNDTGGSAASGAGSDAAGASAAASGSAMTASAPLAGEAEIADRKGTWKYEGGSDDDAAAKQAAAAAEKAKADAMAAEKAAAEKAKADALAAEQAAAQKAKADALAAEQAAAAQAAAEKAKADAATSTPDYDGDGKLEGENEGTRPEALDGPRGGKADNLKEIKGIGPKMEKLCNKLGFYHFDQIAKWTPDEVAWVNANLEGFKGRVTRDTWVEQAKILAAGGETEFSKRVEDGGVY